MVEALFDLGGEYEEMLNQGLRLSGESQDFFIRGRLMTLRARLANNSSPRRILDFGCGIGNATRRLADMFDSAEVVGTDTSEKALQYATRGQRHDRVHFVRLDELIGEDAFDLCHVNGVFHHIEPRARVGALKAIRSSLRAGGQLALFENNPWNPGTRMVMKRIPFDREAMTFSVIEARRLVRAAGFAPLAHWSLFYFPRSLAALRSLEGILSRLPLGAQYCVLATKPLLNPTSQSTRRRDSG